MTTSKPTVQLIWDQNKLGESLNHNDPIIFYDDYKQQLVDRIANFDLKKLSAHLQVLINKTWIEDPEKIDPEFSWDDQNAIHKKIHLAYQRWFKSRNSFIQQKKDIKRQKDAKDRKNLAKELEKSDPFIINLPTISTNRDPISFNPLSNPLKRNLQESHDTDTKTDDTNNFNNNIIGLVNPKHTSKRTKLFPTFSENITEEQVNYTYIFFFSIFQNLPFLFAIFFCKSLLFFKKKNTCIF